MNLLPRFLCIPVLITILFTTSSWTAALWLYEGDTPDLGTASPGPADLHRYWNTVSLE